MSGKHAKHTEIENGGGAEEEASLPEKVSEAETELIAPVEDTHEDFIIETVGSEAPVAAPAQVPVAPQVAPAVAPPGVSASKMASINAADLPVIEPDQSAYVGAGAPKKRKVLKAVLITLVIIVVLLAAVYGAGVYVFSQRFLPNTSFGELDVSMQTLEEVEQQINSKVDGYQLDVVGGAFSYRATSEELGLKVDSAKMASEMLDSQDQWRWPLLILQGKQEVTSNYALTYDSDKLNKAVRKQVKSYNEGATAPVNATVVYDEKTDAFVVQPEVPGTQYKPKGVAKLADEAVMTLNPLVSLTEDSLIQAEIKSDDERLKTAAEEATKMVSSHMKFTLAGEEAGEIGPDDLHDLVYFDEDLNVSLDEDALNVWIDGIVKRYDTVGTERHYTRYDGKEITVSGGEYGWEVDQDSLRQAVFDCVYSGSDIEMDIPCYSYAQVFNGVGEPDWGNRYADVDLSEQYVRFYDENGDCIWESDCITGTPDGEHDTVEGVWKINNKESPSKLIGRDKNGKKEYETMVQYWMAFEQNSIGFHDATWQPGFGGEMFRQGYGSHGCVNLPYDKAQELYDIIDWDDVVIVHW